MGASCQLYYLFLKGVLVNVFLKGILILFFIQSLGLRQDCSKKLQINLSYFFGRKINLLTQWLMLLDSESLEQDLLGSLDPSTASIGLDLGSFSAHGLCPGLIFWPDY